MVNNHGDRKSPKDRVMGPLPNGQTSWLINGGDPNHLRPSWDDPPSTVCPWKMGGNSKFGIFRTSKGRLFSGAFAVSFREGKWSWNFP